MWDLFCFKITVLPLEVRSKVGVAAVGIRTSVNGIYGMDVVSRE